jgi:hypothetical protein
MFRFLSVRVRTLRGFSQITGSLLYRTAQIGSVSRAHVLPVDHVDLPVIADDVEQILVHGPIEAAASVSRLADGGGPVQ